MRNFQPAGKTTHLGSAVHSLARPTPLIGEVTSHCLIYFFHRRILPCIERLTTSILTYQIVKCGILEKLLAVKFIVLQFVTL